MQIGYIVSNVYTSQAQIPVKDAVFTVTKEEDGETMLLGVRISDENGKTFPIAIETPDLSESLSPGNPQPYALVNIRIDHSDYKSVYTKGVEVFPGIVTLQNYELFPIVNYSSYNNMANINEVNV